MRRSSSQERQPLPKGFGTIWTTVAIDLIGFGIVLPILPQYAEKFGASATTIGVLVASFSLAQLVFAPLWGRLSDRIGRKPVLLISLFGTAVGSLLTGVAGGVAGGWPCCSWAGSSTAHRGPACRWPRRRWPTWPRRGTGARLMGLLGAAFGVGFVAGPAIGAIGALVGPQVPFYIAAVISCVERDRGHPAPAGDLARPRRSRRPIRRRPSVRGRSCRADALDELGALALEAELERVGTLDGPQPGTPFEAAGRSSDPGGSNGRAVRAGASGGGRRRSRARVDVQVIIRLITVSFVGMVAFSGFEATFALLTDARFGLDLSGTGAVFTVIGLALVAVQVGVVGRVNDRLGESNTLRAGLVCNAMGLALLAVDGGWADAGAEPGPPRARPGPDHADAVVRGGRRAGRARGSWLGWQQSAGGLARVLGPILAGAVFQHVGSVLPTSSARCSRSWR